MFTNREERASANCTEMRDGPTSGSVAEQQFELELSLEEAHRDEQSIGLACKSD